MKVVALCSGGKDSAFALWVALQQGHEVTRIVSMIPRREDSWMFHFPNIHLVDLSSECAKIPLTKAETSGIKDQELEDLKQMLQTLEVEGVVSGGITSAYQKKRIEQVCQELGLKSITPLWGHEPFELLREMLNADFKILITGVHAYGFDQSWLGRKLDEAALHDLIELSRKYKINLSGEGGEYETLVLDAPFFKKRIEPVEVERIWKRDSGYLLVKKARLAKKEWK